MPTSKPIFPRDELIEIIPDYDGLAVRSTKVTEKSSMPQTGSR